MINSIKFLLRTKLKTSSINNSNSGFTLIELLVALLLAFLVITPLMAFMINVMENDRKEQAKATTEQELQAAIDYINRDLQQAIYIYDVDGLTRDNSTTISSSGIKNQIPPVIAAPNCAATSAGNTNVCTPVLVFWKRELAPNSVNITTPSGVTTSDGFAYSLVAYYLITNPNGTNTNWSSEARIGRWQIRGPVNLDDVNAQGSGEPGFNPPPLNQNGATLKEKMNQWKTSLAAGSSYTQRVETLIDYISTSTGAPANACSSGQRTGSVDASNNVRGFYACVNANEILAQVYIRGNALARLQNNNFTYVDGARNYFPIVNVQVQGRSYVYTK
jgi:type II secretory pathway component PulJ